MIVNTIGEVIYFSAKTSKKLFHLKIYLLSNCEYKYNFYIEKIGKIPQKSINLFAHNFDCAYPRNLIEI